MRIAILTALSVAMLSAGVVTSAQAEDQPYYNPTNPASPTGFTTGYELYRTIGCPGKQLLDKPCAVPAAAPAPVAAAEPAPAPAPAPAPVAAPEPAPAPVAAPAPAPEPTLTKEHPLVLKDVNFDFDSAKLRKGAFPILDRAAEDLKSANYPHVQIDGYTDSVGKDAYNMKLSDRRAESVKKYLTGKGVPADSLSTKGYGETHFIATNKTKAGRAENRRVELHVK
jgi:outer membrane protein OmpA-like peptidoglycan-associated protein